MSTVKKKPTERWLLDQITSPPADGKRRRPSIKHSEQRYAKVHTQLQEVERDLLRTFNRWAKLKKQERYYGKLLDKDFAERE